MFAAQVVNHAKASNETTLAANNGLYDLTFASALVVNLLTLSEFEQVTHPVVRLLRNSLLRSRYRRSRRIYFSRGNAQTIGENTSLAVEIVDNTSSIRIALEHHGAYPFGLGGAIIFNLGPIFEAGLGLETNSGIAWRSRGICDTI